MSNIILFGATGAIGAYTATDLKSKGHDVIAVGKRKNDNDFFRDNGMQYISLDISKKEDFSLLPKNKIDIVVHLAGAMPANMASCNPYNYVNSIVIGTLNILEYMRENSIKKIIFSHSISDVLHLFGSTIPIMDDNYKKFPLIGDHSVYSICKNTAVNLIEHYFHQYKIKRFILRLPTIYLYHPNVYYYVDGNKRMLGYMSLILNALKGKDIEIWGNSQNIKEMVYIKDLTQLICCCVDSHLDGGIYNAGSGFAIPFEEQVKIIANTFNSINKKSEIIYLPNKPSSPQFVLDINKARKELGYNPVYDCQALYKAFKETMEIEPFHKLWGKMEDYLNEQ